MSEEKKEIKKKTATTKKKTSTKKIEENTTENMTMTPEMMQQMMMQMMAQMQQMQQMMVQQQNTATPMSMEVVDEKETKTVWTKAMLSKIRDEYVEVRSVFDGIVSYISPKTKIEYSWLEKGAVETLTIEEVLLMNTKKVYLNTPVLIVEDDRVNEALKLTNIIKGVEAIENIEEFIEKDLHEIEEIIQGLTNEQRLNLRDEIANMLRNKQIRDYVVADTLQKLLDIEDIDVR